MELLDASLVLIRLVWTHQALQGDNATDKAAKVRGHRWPEIVGFVRMIQSIRSSDKLKKWGRSHARSSELQMCWPFHRRTQAPCMLGEDWSPPIAERKARPVQKLTAHAVRPKKKARRAN